MVAEWRENGKKSAMEEDDRLKEGRMELVLPGSTAFDDRILPPLHDSYLYDDSRKSFLYSSAHLINNVALQTRYAAFRAEKRECGYTEKELEESFGFLLFDDENKATELGDRGLLTGHCTCSTLGEPSKGVCVSKYSDCLDLRPWYSGKSGHIAIIKLTKGRVKEVMENYTLKFTPPTRGFDSHVSEQIKTVTAATSSFLAFERTQYYIYELLNGGEDAETCPRHVYPFAIVAFSYGEAETAVPGKTEHSEEKAVFDYRPWTGRLAIDSLVFEIGLKSNSGALIPAKLPKTLTVKNVIRVTDLKALLPKEVFETCFSGDIFVGGKCCSVYEVIATNEQDTSLCLLIDELKEKDLALVFLLSDSGVFVMLHSSYFLSYEDASFEKTESLHGLFMFPDSHTIQRDTKSVQRESALSSAVLRVLPALNYAEMEVEKSGADQHSEIRTLFEQHLKNYRTLIQPGLQNSPQREASMFPDQYDVPGVFKHLYPLPRWTEVIGLRVMLYLNDPRSFEIPVKRASELMCQQQNRDDPDDEVYYYISSPEEPPSDPASDRADTPLEPKDDSPTDDVAAEDLSKDCVPSVSPPSDNMTSCAAMAEDLVKQTNAEESPQGRGTDSPLLATVPDGIESAADERSPEDDRRYYTEDSPVSQPAAIKDCSKSDTQQAVVCTPLKRRKSLRGKDRDLIDNSVGVDSATDMLAEDDDDQPKSSPVSGCAQPADWAVDSPEAEEAGCGSLSVGSQKLPSPGADASVTEASRDRDAKISPSELKLSPAMCEELCKTTTEESASSQTVSGHAESPLEAEVSVLTATPQGSEDTAEVRQSNMDKFPPQSNQASATSKDLCEQGLDKPSCRSLLEGQELLDAVDSDPVASLPSELPTTPKVFKEYNESESHTEKAHSILNVVESEKPQAEEAEVISLSETVSIIDAPAERLIQNGGQDDNTRSDRQQPNEDVSSKSNHKDDGSSPLAVCTETPPVADDKNCPSATLPAVIDSSAAAGSKDSHKSCELSSESVQDAEPEDLCSTSVAEQQALLAGSEKHLEPDVNSPTDTTLGGVRRSSTKMPTDASKREDSCSEKSKTSDKTAQSCELGACAEKSLEPQVVGVATSNLPEAVDLTVEVSEGNNTLRESSSSVSDRPPSLLSDVVVSSKPEIEHLTTGDVLTDHDKKEDDGDSMRVTTLQRSSDAAEEVMTENRAPQVSPKPRVQENTGKTDKPLKKVGSGGPDTTVEDKTPLKRGRKRRRGRSSKRLVLIKPTISPQQQQQQQQPMPRSIGPPSLVLTETTHVELEGEEQKLPSLDINQSSLSVKQNDDVLLVAGGVAEQVDPLGNKSAPLKSLEHNYSQKGKAANQSSEVSTAIELFPSKKKDGKTLRRYSTRRERNNKQQGDSPKQGGDIKPSVEIIIQSKQVRPLKRKLNLDSLNHDLRTVITDCGKVFVPHGSEMLPGDVELAMKRQKAADGGKGLRRIISPKGPGPVTRSSSDSARDAVTGESRFNEWLARKDSTKDPLSLTPERGEVLKRQLGEQFHSPKNVSAERHATRAENYPSLHKEVLDRLPNWLLGLEDDSNSQTQVTFMGQEMPTEGSDDNISLSDTKADEDVSLEASQLNRTTESDGKGEPPPQKAKRKRSATYTVIPISDLRTVFKVKGLDLGAASELDSKRLKDGGEDADGSGEESNPASVSDEVAVNLQGGLKAMLAGSTEGTSGGNPGVCAESALTDEIVPLSEMASTSTKKHNTLLKKWQKINATDIFRDQGALRSPSSDPLSITGPEELHGSDDGIFVQIQLESAVEPPWSESERKAAGKQEDPRGAGPSSKKPRTSNFRWHRKIVQKGELIEVSRQWTETYDFTLDSKFIKNPRDETVSRALHGPWKFNVNDTEEQIHLIFHMWIGLFYSKTASRFFHLGSDRPPPEEYAGGGDSKSAKDAAEPVLDPASMSSKSDSVTTNAPDDTTSSSSVKAVPSTRLFEPQLMLQLTDDCSDASGPQCEAQRPPESPPYEVLDLSLKGCKPSDPTTAAADASAGEEAISDHPGGEQVCGGFEGPLDMRTRAPSELNVTSIISEEPCSTEGTMVEDKNTTTDDVVATSMMMISCKNDCVIKQGDFSSGIARTSKPLDLSGKTLDLFDRFREDHNPVVTQDGKIKYRFFTLVTSEDPFFRKTKEQLEADGHTAVEPEGFELESCSPASPLLIIVRNEDIAEHICEIPHLLELKKSSSVVFAGIDRPDDILNLTHEELFCKGGFLMFDGTSLKKLTLESMKRTVAFLEELGRKGKWKWFLHYRDSRSLREDARTSEDARDRKHFLDGCQEAGPVEVLPYHECDVITQERPNYLQCLVRLQVQNATRRFPVFITESTDESFRKSGIFTLTETFGI